LPADKSRSFDLTGRVAIVTGGYGVLGGMISSGLASSGVRVAVLGRRRDAADAKADEIRRAGGDAIALAADVLDEQQLRDARDSLNGDWQNVDILVNAAGGNVARARNDNRSIFEVPVDAFDEVLRLNLHGTVIPSLVFGETMARRGSGCIVNISSMASLQALSGVLGYSVAKAGIDNFTRWLAVDLARKHGDGVRVNAIAPGFFVSTQNRAVLIDDAGAPTARARTIIGRTPMGRFGDPEELLGPVRWLCSDAASFVTGVVIPVDGGFSAFSGV
jgi:NAD(P)-dependent dehydrogenase (short-subunit alcohol dehydrogenase family)